MGIGLSETTVMALRREFPGLERLAAQGVVLADGAGGSQVHASVLTAMQEQMIQRNFNVGAPFRGSRENLRTWSNARGTMAALLNCAPHEVT